MNVFILDTDMIESARMLDDAHLRAQINEGVQILMTIYNMRSYPGAKIGYAKHPVVEEYDREDRRLELTAYLSILLLEYRHRFGKDHAYWFWIHGYVAEAFDREPRFPIGFNAACTYIGKKTGGYIFTNDPAQVRFYIMTKSVQKAPVWTNSTRPKWWLYYIQSLKLGDTRKIQFSTWEAVKE